MRQTRTWARFAAVAVTFALPIGFACSAGSTDGTNGRAGANSGGSSGQSDGGTGAISLTGGSSSGGSGNGGSGINIDGGSSGGSSSSGDACAGSSYEGEQKPLDMFIMFDQSGSMGSDCCNGSTRWDAIKGALIEFVQTPQSDGIGIGIQYFPLDAPQVDCAANPNDPGCECFGLCPGFLCFCINNGGGSCVVSDYATPDVPIQLLPGVSAAMVSSLNAHGPNGGTPTYPALQGAMQYAVPYAAQNPGRKTIVVLATDGDPNDCNSNVGNVSQVAAAGLANNPSVQTYVIGVGSIANLDTIAQAGGTGQALVVDNANAGQQFLAAMNQIRGMALSCEFTIPLPDNQPANYNEVNVKHNGDLVYKVGSEAECDPTRGGWYYDDPSAPQYIRLCPVTCDTVTTAQGRVDIELHCPTVPLPPA